MSTEITNEPFLYNKLSIWSRKIDEFLISSEYIANDDLKKLIDIARFNILYRLNDVYTTKFSEQLGSRREDFYIDFDIHFEHSVIIINIFWPKTDSNNVHDVKPITTLQYGASCMSGNEYVYNLTYIDSIGQCIEHTYESTLETPPNKTEMIDMLRSYILKSLNIE